ncbi:hypothetical protein MSAN_01185800 [Mycena sanguinolenta]|uniref:Uncharacterized protein n=1 Tax=Mycena sanguinolenta TaxID=230812 RepID=A0A8H6YMS6_9AGAR|nr:hypothetical protein MSAN_01185800 [Mycena sanguinolenta]
MSDLTVLVSPIPLYPRPSSPFSSIASRRNRSPSPIMVTLESSPPSMTESQARTDGPSMDPGLLSPPLNTWKSRPRGRTDSQRPRHRSTRSQSAPPTQTTSIVPAEPFSSAPVPTSTDDLNLSARSGVPPIRKPPRRAASTFGAGYSYSTEGMTLRGGELVRPPPPLLRPTTFWRKAHRSGVASATYSPSAHLIRRSTYIAAGLKFDAPMHDLSALCVETRLNGEEGVRRGSPRVVEIPQAFELFL